MQARVKARVPSELTFRTNIVKYCDAICCCVYKYGKSGLTFAIHVRTEG